MSFSSSFRSQQQFMQQIVISCLDRRLFIRAFIFTNGGNWVDVCILPQRNMTSENDLYYCERRVLIHYSKANLVFFPRGLLLPPLAAIPRQMIIQLAVVCWKGFCKTLQTRHTQQVLSRKRQRNKINNRNHEARLNQRVKSNLTLKIILWSFFAICTLNSRSRPCVPSQSKQERYECCYRQHNHHTSQSSCDGSSRHIDDAHLKWQL